MTGKKAKDLSEINRTSSGTVLKEENRAYLPRIGEGKGLQRKIGTRKTERRDSTSYSMELQMRIQEKTWKKRGKDHLSLGGLAEGGPLIFRK